LERSKPPSTPGGSEGTPERVEHKVVAAFEVAVNEAVAATCFGHREAAAAIFFVWQSACKRKRSLGLCRRGR